MSRNTDRYNLLKGLGLCTRCGKHPPLPQLTLCATCQRRQKDLYTKRYAVRTSAGLCPMCGRNEPEPNKTVCTNCNREHLERQANNRKLVLSHYGGTCAVCRETTLQFLTIDHLNNDGCEQSDSQRAQLVAFIIKNNFPADFQILCWNHNYLKWLKLRRVGLSDSKQAIKSRRRDIKLRTAVFDHYGWICVCCGLDIDELLTIDHVNGGGIEHQAELGGAGCRLWRWLRNNDFPPDFQTLCRNCNSGRAVNGGICPHKQLN